MIRALPPGWTPLRPPVGRAAYEWRELWAHRELLVEMVRRDLRARYSQSLLGGAWGVIQPLLLMGLFYLIFGVVLRLRVGPVPYPLFLLAGVLGWQLFSGVASAASGSVLSNIHLVQKSCFPRLVLPAAACCPPAYDVLISLGILIVLSLAAGVAPGWAALAAPGFLLLALAFGLAIGIWVSAIGARYRDVRHALPFLLQVLLYASPVFYSPTYVPAEWRAFYYLNPLAGAIQGLRWALLGDVAPDAALAWGALSTGVLLAAGLWYFRSVEALFADVL